MGPPDKRKGPLAGGPLLRNVDFAGFDFQRIPRLHHRKQARHLGPGEHARLAEMRRRGPCLRVIDGGLA